MLDNNYIETHIKIRTCKKCLEIKPFEDFVKTNTGTGRMHTCKKCMAKKARNRNLKIQLPKHTPNIFRICKKCNQDKLLSEFTISKNCKFGRTHTCKLCTFNKYEAKKIKIVRVEPKNRICKKCNETKDLDKFVKGKANRWGRQHVCKDCCNTQLKNTRIKKPRVAPVLKNGNLRTCKKCGEEKDINNFAKRPTCCYGRGYTCIVCDNKRMAEYEKYRSKADPIYRKKRNDRKKKYVKRAKKGTCKKCKENKLLSRFDMVLCICNDCKKNATKAKSAIIKAYHNLGLRWCNDCGQFLSEDEFKKKIWRCEDCETKRILLNRENNGIKSKLPDGFVNRKQWIEYKVKKYKKHGEIWCNTCKQWFYKNNFHKSTGGFKGYMYKCKSCTSFEMKKYFQRPGIKEHRNVRAIERCKTDPMFKLNKHISLCIRNSLNGTKKGSRWEHLVGYTFLDFRKHFERLFKDGMTWNNHGNGIGKWNIDHIIPIVKFNFTKPEHKDFQRCWALSNLQPMWSLENMKKGDKLSKPFQPSLQL